MANYAGVDWASEKQDVVRAGRGGEELWAASFAHDETGLRSLCHMLVRMEVTLVAIERPERAVGGAATTPGCGFCRCIPIRSPRRVLASGRRAASPTASTRSCVIVTEKDRRVALGEATVTLRRIPSVVGLRRQGRRRTQRPAAANRAAAEHLAENFHRAPGIVLACALGRANGRQRTWRSTWPERTPGNVSVMLAARPYGLGTCWTGISLAREQRTAGIVGIPYNDSTIGAISPVRPHARHRVHGCFASGSRRVDSPRDW